MRGAAREDARERTAEVAEQAARRLEDFVRTRLRMVELVRDQYVNGAVSRPGDFTKLSQSLQEEFVGFQAINWLDESCTIR